MPAFSEIDRPALAALLGAPIADYLSGLEAPSSLPGPHDLAAEVDQLVQAGAQQITLGRSTGGEPIRAVIVGRGRRRVLCYGFPHPDEGLGALAMVWLARGLVSANPALDALDASFCILFCADPDIAAENLPWLGARSVRDFCLGSVRIEHLSREIDYGFPVDCGPLWQPEWRDGGRACRSAGRCLTPAICGTSCRRLREMPGPLPESLAIAAAMRRFRPDLVVSLHDTHSGGCFNFLLNRPDDRLAGTLRAIPAACGLPRHLGQRIDSGRPWSATDQDLIREPRIAAEIRRLERRADYQPGMRYLGNVSASMFLETEIPGAQFLVPEAPHFSHPDFGDVALLDESITIERRRISTRKGLRTADFVRHDDQELLVRMRPASDRTGRRRVPLSVGILGALAVARRRRLFEEADRIWASCPAAVRESDHPIAAERRALRVPARAVNDRSMLIYRVDPSYDRVASVAHAADFRWRWNIHTAARIGPLARLCIDHGAPDEAGRFSDLVDAALEDLPTSLRFAHARRAGAISQLARIMAVVSTIGRS